MHPRMMLTKTNKINNNKKIITIPHPLKTQTKIPTIQPKKKNNNPVLTVLLELSNSPDPLKNPHVHHPFRVLEHNFIHMLQLNLTML